MRLTESFEGGIEPHPREGVVAEREKRPFEIGDIDIVPNSSTFGHEIAPRSL